MDFVIDRSTWRCGGITRKRGLGSTLLLNDEGFMCCLGQVSCQLGVPKLDIKNKISPADIVEYHESFLITNGKNSEFSNLAMHINDDTLNDVQRETHLINLFNEYGHTVKFVEEYVYEI